MNLVSLIYSRYKAKRIIKRIPKTIAPIETKYNEYETIDERFVEEVGLTRMSGGLSDTWLCGDLPILKKSMVWKDPQDDSSSERVFSQAKGNMIIKTPEELSNELKRIFLIK
jgi:hypothetical protein